MSWLFYILICLMLAGCYVGSLIEMRREIRKANTVARESQKDSRTYRQRIEYLENKLSKSEARDAERRTAYRALLDERNDLERQLKIKSALLDKLAEQERRNAR